MFLNTQTEQAVGNLDDHGFEQREGQSVGGIGIDEGGPVRVGGGVSEKERSHGKVRILGEHQRGSERSEDAITATSRFLHFWTTNGEREGYWCVGPQGWLNESLSPKRTTKTRRAKEG